MVHRGTGGEACTTVSKTRTVDKYPREYIAAPSETIEIIHLDGRRYISSAELDLNEADEKRNIHVANMMLECFSAFEVFDICKNKIIGPKLKRLAWGVLPSGKYPWAESKGVINKAASKLDRKGREVVEHRMRVISKLNPNFLATGRAGFSGCFVYEFEGPNVYVLESVYLDNATYIFDSNWEKLSGLTKNEIINGSIPHKRIVHSQRWSVEVGRAIHNK